MKRTVFAQLSLYYCISGKINETSVAGPLPIFILALTLLWRHFGIIPCVAGKGGKVIKPLGFSLVILPWGFAVISLSMEQLTGFLLYVRHVFYSLIFF